MRALASPKPVVPSKYEHTRYDLMTQFVQAYTSIHSSLKMYLADLFAATRHHPELDGTLLTLQAHYDAEDLVRAFRVISSDTTGTELVETLGCRNPSPRNSQSTDYSYDHVSRMDVESFGWGKEDQEVLMSYEGQDIEVHVHAPDTPTPRQNGYTNGTAYPFTSDLHTRAIDAQPLPPAEQWDVSEVDIARIFPRVVSHRLSVRHGPDDEIFGSVMFPAVVHDLEFDDQRTSMVRLDAEPPVPPARRTVKEILVGILADV